ncbi:Orotidine 5'-phosphate decarboxylase domain-containing protein [Dactylonectria macrodidyma]|uniref:Orotidine 5'-phosphate decarboxylase n=1 Tax=Dactylonectria macrodidyma TaxID=307937 RepID=A0A9P9IZL8_9HYPO|nr:Orotidine 5'-phosphate decarboxylase domain-containing protein [Dactylonectria macrodidyma]
MTTSGSRTDVCVEIARKNDLHHAVMGFVATQSLGAGSKTQESQTDEDFVVFTTGVNRNQKEDNLGQQYQTPANAIKGGSDFIITGRGIHVADDLVAAAKLYQKEGWEAYEERVG